MRLSFISAVLCIIGTAVGCNSQAAAPAPAEKPIKAPSASDQAAEAKAHVQQYIDRLIGGDQSVKGDLLGLAGVDFNKINAIEINSAVPAFSKEGKKLDDTFRVQMKVRGYDDLKRRDIEQTVTRDVYLFDGKWTINQSSL